MFFFLSRVKHNLDTIIKSKSGRDAQYLIGVEELLKCGRK